VLHLAIRCRSGHPIAREELEGWLELEVKDLRTEARQATVRLSRLIEEDPDPEVHAGWLIELEVEPDEPLTVASRLPQLLRDMRLLGLHPTLLTPAQTNGHE
jgi:hypothetical protein